MIPCRGESTDGKPEDSRWSVTVHHSSSIESEALMVSRVKWVEVDSVLQIRIECLVSPGVIEVMHPPVEAKGTGLYTYRVPGERRRSLAGGPRACVMPSREDA